jgi:hypothetical protein
MTMKLYLAGPMSGYPDLNFPLFHAECTRLRGLGLEIINPAEINADPATGWQACMRLDIAELVKCDGIALLPDWHLSRGALLEHHIARSLDMHVFVAAEITIHPHDPVLAEASA